MTGKITAYCGLSHSIPRTSPPRKGRPEAKAMRLRLKGNTKMTFT